MEIYDRFYGMVIVSIMRDLILLSCFSIKN